MVEVIDRLRRVILYLQFSWNVPCKIGLAGFTLQLGFEDLKGGCTRLTIQYFGVRSLCG